MSEAQLLLAALLVACIGMGCFALSLPVHWRQVLGDRHQTSTAQFGLRLAGVHALVATLILCLLADSVAMAALMFTMLLTASALLTAMMLSLHSAVSIGRQRHQGNRPVRKNYR